LGQSPPPILSRLLCVETSVVRFPSSVAAWSLGRKSAKPPSRVRFPPSPQNRRLSAGSASKGKGPLDLYPGSARVRPPLRSLGRIKTSVGCHVEPVPGFAFQRLVAVRMGSPALARGMRLRRKSNSLFVFVQVLTCCMTTNRASVYTRCRDG
jgi:hypothetical protein